ncbi:MAG TPA: [acyl-carrier-protein] S-malonyltransferase, partial [Patescibacteria group bacterium]|nr:[acyl-carrier-protein] S-malonyltransferase [Patescibacteria group bacterium]
MSKIACIFPGQGAQYSGMGKEIAENYKQAMDIFDIASERLGIDMKKLCFEGSEEELKKTENTQPSILTTSIAI